MKTLQEVKRDIQRAAKLGSYLAKRAKGRWPSRTIPFKDSKENEQKAITSYSAYFRLKKKTNDNDYENHLWDKQAKVKTIPTKSLIPTQDGTDWNAKHFITVKSKDKDPVLVLKRKDKHYIWDGHHRYMSKRLQGIPDMEVKVLDLDKPGEHEKSSIKEDAPANAAGGGNIAGIGVGAQGEPGVPKKLRRKHTILRRAPPLQEGLFAGLTTLLVPESVIQTAVLEKRKFKHWRTYLPENDVGLAIREWAQTNPCSPIILEGPSGHMVFAKYGVQNNK